jgi:energy-coupling factor transport system substrate-specific component
MFAAGWIGMSAPLCRPLVRLGLAILGLRFDIQDPKSKTQNLEVVVLAAFAGLWGLIYGAIINVSFWPFAVGPAAQYWEPGIGVGDTLRRYLAFYLATSIGWDIMRTIGNVLLTLALGAPTLRILNRFKRRFAFDYRPVYGSNSYPCEGYTDTFAIEAAAKPSQGFLQRC